MGQSWPPESAMDGFLASNKGLSQWSGAQGDGEGQGLTASPRTPGGGKDRTLS